MGGDLNEEAQNQERGLRQSDPPKDKEMSEPKSRICGSCGKNTPFGRIANTSRGSIWLCHGERNSCFPKYMAEKWRHRAERGARKGELQVLSPEGRVLTQGKDVPF